MIPPQLHIVRATDTGQLRSHNEDYLDSDEELGVVVLADGMGGYQAGEIASEIAVKKILETMRKHLGGKAFVQPENSRGEYVMELLRQAVEHANRTIFDSAQNAPEYYGMGTTVVAAVFYDNCVSIAHVGDSRLYRLRGEELRQLTTDHSVLQELIEQGLFTPEEARRSPSKNLVTRALGVSYEIQVDVQESEVAGGDLFLLCSDGLNDMLEDRTIRSILLDHLAHPEKAVRALIEAANAAGGEDNISVILVQCRPRTSAPRSWWESIKAGFPFKAGQPTSRKL